MFLECIDENLLFTTSRSIPFLRSLCLSKKKCEVFVVFLKRQSSITYNAQMKSIYPIDSIISWSRIISSVANCHREICYHIFLIFSYDRTREGNIKNYHKLWDWKYQLFTWVWWRYFSQWTVASWPHQGLRVIGQ